MWTSSLEELGKKYGTDKVEHGYLPIYQKHLAEVRTKIQFKKILEIGVWFGHSLQMWHEWFDGRVEIHGIDTDISRWHSREISDPSIMVHKGDQTDREFLNTMGREFGTFDLIIDDGSHIMPHAQQSMIELFKYLTPGGLYCIEDLHTCEILSYQRKGYVKTTDFLTDEAKLMVTGKSLMFKTNFDIESIAFYKGLCVIEKIGSPHTARAECTSSTCRNHVTHPCEACGAVHPIK